MSRSPRLTYNAALVLIAIARGHRYGFDIMDVTGLPSGTTYPILRRFELDELVRSRWETSRQAHRNGRPRRRYYELTDAGHVAVSRAVERFSEHHRVLADVLSSEVKPTS